MSDDGSERRERYRTSARYLALTVAGLYAFIGIDSLRTGSPDDRVAGWILLAVLAVGVIGAIGVRLEPAGMARTFLVLAVLQATVFAVMLALGLGATGVVVFVNLFLLATVGTVAWLYHKSL